MPIEGTPIPGAVRLTLTLVEVRAVKNPETFGKGEWDLRVTVNGLERWRTERHLSIGEGEVARVGADIQTEIGEKSQYVDVELSGIEKDRLGADDRATGTARLYRFGGFERDRGFTIDVLGPDTHLEARFGVAVSPA